MEMQTLGLGIAAIVLTVAAVVIAIVKRGAGTRAAVRVGGVIAGWLGFAALTAGLGVFSFDRGPLGVLPLAGGAIFGSMIALRDGVLVGQMSRTAVIALQTFRVPVELVLWGLARAGAIPAVLSFEGANFDIAVGLTALPVALVTRVRPRLAIVWHVAGVGLLANVVVRAMRASPHVLSTVPFVWLPAFLVPVALVGHVVGIRQAIRAAADRGPGVRAVRARGADAG